MYHVQMSIAYHLNTLHLLLIYLSLRLHTCVYLWIGRSNCWEGKGGVVVINKIRYSFPSEIEVLVTCNRQHIINVLTFVTYLRTKVGVSMSFVPHILLEGDHVRIAPWIRHLPLMHFTPAFVLQPDLISIDTCVGLYHATVASVCKRTHLRANMPLCMC